jgi:hypothetical protein
MRATVFLVVSSCALTVVHAAEPSPTAVSTPQSAVVPRGATAQPPDTTRKPMVARRVPRSAAAVDDLRLLGDIKVLGMAEGEARLRVDGVEQSIRPGMLLKTDVVKSISPQRMVLVRPEAVDTRKGETLIIVDVLDGGRTRVRMYATRNWTARPRLPLE